MFQRLVKFIKEVRNEIKRVSWPSRDEIRESTTVVIVIVLVLAVFIGLVDRALILPGKLRLRLDRTTQADTAEHCHPWAD